MNVRKAHAKATKQVEDYLAAEPCEYVVMRAWSLVQQVAEEKGLDDLFTSSISGKGWAIMALMIINSQRSK